MMTNSANSSLTDNVAKTRSAPLSTCIKNGGVIMQNGNCLCPDGYTSAYDAFITNDFCTIATEYSASVSTEHPESGDSTDTLAIMDVPHTVRLSGVIQFSISFCICMLLVCGIRSIHRSFRPSKQDYPPQPQYYYS